MVECNHCHKILTQEELDEGYNMYESKLCSICIKELKPTNDEDDLSTKMSDE